MHHNQQTLKSSVTFKGIGVHSGRTSSVTLWPAPANHGVIFISTHHPAMSIAIGSIVPEAAMHATVIKKDGWAVSTIEHLMAALWLLGIDNVVVEVDGSEIPILDGSAYHFTHGILVAGSQDLGVPRLGITPRQKLVLNNDNNQSITIDPEGCQANVPYHFNVTYTADFKSPLAGNATFAAGITPAFFIRELAPARTFGFLEQLPFLRQHKLAQASSLGNTVVIGDGELLNQMRLPDECVRHKVLDLLGDLSLLGKQLIGNVAAKRTSHNFNRLVIEHYLKHPDAWVVVE